MSDQHQHVHTEVVQISWLERIKGAIVGIVVGLVLVLVGAAVLVLNEGRAVATANSLDEGAAAVRSIRCSVGPCWIRASTRSQSRESRPP